MHSDRNKVQADIRLGTDKNTKKLFKKYTAKSKLKDRINFVKKGDQVFSGDRNIADGFNTFFGSIFSKDSGEAEGLGNNRDIIDEINCISNFEIDREQVLKIINSLNIHKSVGPDKISARILREGVDSISYALTIIFNRSLTCIHIIVKERHEYTYIQAHGVSKHI